MVLIPKPGYVVITYSDGRDVEMPESEALAYKPQPITEEHGKFLWLRNIYIADEAMFKKRLGDSVRFGDAVSPITGKTVDTSIAVFIREDHDYFVLNAADFHLKYGWA